MMKLSPKAIATFFATALACFIGNSPATAMERFVDQPQAEIQNNTSAAIHSHNVCRVVTNRSGARLMVPTRSRDEWVAGNNSFVANVTAMPGISVKACGIGGDVYVTVSQPYGRPASIGVVKNSSAWPYTSGDSRSPTCEFKSGQSLQWKTGDTHDELYRNNRSKIRFPDDSPFCWISFRYRSDSGWTSGDNDRWKADYITRAVRIWPE